MAKLGIYKGVTIFQGAADQHGGDGEQAEEGEPAHAERIFFRWAGVNVSQAVRRTRRGARLRIFIK